MMDHRIVSTVVGRRRSSRSPTKMITAAATAFTGTTTIFLIFILCWLSFPHIVAGQQDEDAAAAAAAAVDNNIGASSSSSSTAVARADSSVCPAFRVDQLASSYCRRIPNSYLGLRDVIEEASSGDVLHFCPFTVSKVMTDPPIVIKAGVTLKCTPSKEDEWCTIKGGGKHLEIQTPPGEKTIIQGFSFREADDYAVHILSPVVPDETEGEDEQGQGSTKLLPTNTFCQTSFLSTERDKDSRGGAVMIDRQAGVVNLYETLFNDNWTKTFGAAVYSRANQLNILSSVFINNKSQGYGGAVFVASGSKLMIESTMFVNNKGRDSYDVVMNSKAIEQYYVDGTGNTISKNSGDGVSCHGIYNMNSDDCTPFLDKVEEATTETTKPSSDTTSQVTNSTIEPTFEPTRQEVSATGLPSALEATTMKPTSKENTTSGPPTNTPTIATATELPTTTDTSPPTTEQTNEVATAAPTSKATSEEAPDAEGSSGVLNITDTDSVSAQDEDAMSISDSNTDVGGTDGDRNDLCRIDDQEKNDSSCWDVDSFESFAAAIEESGLSNIVFCGGFEIRKKISEKPVSITQDVDVRCVKQCTVYGQGTFIEISGGLTHVRLDNFRFMNNIDTAVRVVTKSKTGVTTICNSEFSSNNVLAGVDGGALSVGPQSGFVNIVHSIFDNNSARNGGAVSFKGFRLSVIDSRFNVNIALYRGNAIFMDVASNMVIKDTSFVLNSLNSQDSPDSSTETEDDEYAIVAASARPGGSLRVPSGGGPEGRYFDRGGNSFVLSGECSGIYNEDEATCKEFGT